MHHGSPANVELSSELPAHENAAFCMACSYYYMLLVLHSNAKIFVDKNPGLYVAKE